MLALQGHEAAVQCIRFTNKSSDDNKKSKPHMGLGNPIENKASEMKTIEQIREEAKVNIEKRMQAEAEQ